MDTSKHSILTAAHPSGLSASRGFFGCKHFSQANDLLTAKGITPIDWQLEPAADLEGGGGVKGKAVKGRALAGGKAM